MVDYDELVTQVMTASLPGDRCDIISGVVPEPEAKDSRWHLLMLALLGDQAAADQLGVKVGMGQNGTGVALDSVAESALVQLVLLAPDDSRTTDVIEKRMDDRTRPLTRAVAWFIDQKGTLPNPASGSWVMLNADEVLPDEN